MNKIKFTYLMMGAMLFTTACSSDLNQIPSVNPQSESLTDFTNVLNAAYYYQATAVTPMAVMGDFRADNAYMFEAPYSDFDAFSNGAIITQDAEFFRPFYSGLYKSILSANIVITKSTNASQKAEAKFLRALAYFKLVQVFGPVTINLSDAPSTSDTSILARRSVADVYALIISDLIDAKTTLGATKSTTGRATKYAAQGLLGKVYMTRANPGDITLAKTELSTVVSGASAAGFNLIAGASYATIFTVDNNAETLFATQLSSSISDEYSGSDFWSWFSGANTKSLNPIDGSLTAAFAASGSADVRKAVVIKVATPTKSNKYGTAGANADWIELRLADVILLYAEALNEEADNAAARTLALVELNKIRTRAGLANTTAATQVALRAAIANDRRLELAFEGQRWFDLLRYNKVTPGATQAALASTAIPTPSFSNNYYLFPIPSSEISASFNVITQNPGY
ncbi:RagB/SusD family nutrient uptake outer membrane protein [Frigoriflavimonas asaccharolytica]|uniref:Outer membrane starch-binding protein n=1 Tax=Frigoriflavimonas asaccharolytica TaxID=2735899 RepID=A0A8J8G7B7_9FLAO|nr:RagB/SusD family nutrient uptake outer membrane protein [Frigoriflavimonas asaccharolytica]NRS92619.1 hypothetical protein [Frigoriflavimonas asaccharolytica]